MAVSLYHSHLALFFSLSIRCPRPTVPSVVPPRRTEEGAKEAGGHDLDEAVGFLALLRRQLATQRHQHLQRLVRLCARADKGKRAHDGEPQAQRNAVAKAVAGEKGERRRPKQAAGGACTAAPCFCSGMAAAAAVVVRRAQSDGTRARGRGRRTPNGAKAECERPATAQRERKRPACMHASRLPSLRLFFFSFLGALWGGECCKVWRWLL